MTVRLVLEQMPNAQRVASQTLGEQNLSIGRGDTVDWRIDDPDTYVSRLHCTVSRRDGKYVVTDESTGGLFVDGAARPLGRGNSAALVDGMRLRLGEFVIRVIDDAEAPATAGASPASRFDFSFGDPDPDPAVRHESRPASLPDPFDVPMTFDEAAGDDPKDTGPILFDDPFTLDPPAPRQPEPDRMPADPDQTPAMPRGDVSDDDARLRDAFFRGLGVCPAGQVSEAEMEALGARFRALTEGLVQLLRMRSMEKNQIRAAATVIGREDVNPLKFLATTDEVIGALINQRAKGYLDPDAAIDASFRDLADHHIRTWTALQSALRQMVDRFDPAAIESDMEQTGMLQTILTGGRSARLWQLYQARYRDIARSAEERFLGEVGADFRNAYEQREKNKP